MIKKKVLFVCLGNICRSPAAEGIMKSIIKKNNYEKIRKTENEKGEQN